MLTPDRPLPAPRDAEHHDHEITAVRVGKTDDGSDRYDFQMVGSGILGVADGPLQFEPRAGDALRLYGPLFGMVRGMEVIRDNQVATLYYRTADEQDAYLDAEADRHDNERRAQFERDRDEMDAQYDALPEIFRQRVDKFRANNPDFRWRFESYELFTCEEAVKIADWLCGSTWAPGTMDVAAATNAMAVFHGESFEFQQERAGLSGGHSGNTFGMACRLATLYATGTDAEDGTPAVVALHGALAPLVGSDEYGCVPSAGAEPVN